jgi:hypothetical protein
MENKKGYAKICLVTDLHESNEDFSKTATGSTIGYETDKMPSWDEALLMWWKSAVNYN